MEKRDVGRFISKLYELRFFPENAESFTLENLDLEETQEMEEINEKMSKAVEIWQEEGDKSDTDNCPLYQNYERLSKEYDLMDQALINNHFVKLGKYTVGTERLVEEYRVIVHFEDYGIYLRADGGWTSYEGPCDFDRWYQVKPVEKTYIDYEPI